MKTHPQSILQKLAAQSGGPPSDFLSFRETQLRLILNLCGSPHKGKRVLEIGGGVSGQAFVLAEKATSVLCIDLPDPETVHADSSSQYFKVLSQAATGHLSFGFASAEAIPLKSSSVDVVFSSFVFEHIADRERAIAEIHRVLVPGGLVITNVPNVMEPTFRILWYALVAVPSQVAKLIAVSSRLDRVVGLKMRNRPPTRWTDRLSWLKEVLKFPTHGVYPSHIKELSQSRPSIWEGLFRDKNFHVIDRFGISFESYFSFWSHRVPIALQKKLHPVVMRKGRSRLARHLSTSYCFVARSSPEPTQTESRTAIS